MYIIEGSHSVKNERKTDVFKQAKQQQQNNLKNKIKIISNRLLEN